MADVFISHDESDGEIAYKISEELEELGYSTWLYERDAKPGPVHFVQTGKSIEECKAFLIICSVESAKSIFVWKELENAVVSGKPIIPLLWKIQYKEFVKINTDFKHAIIGATAKLIPEINISPIIASIAELFRDLGIKPDSKPTIIEPIIGSVDGNVLSEQSQDAIVHTGTESIIEIPSALDVPVKKEKKQIEKSDVSDHNEYKQYTKDNFKIACSIVTRGVHGNLGNIPFERFGRLLAVGRTEIEGFKNIEILLTKFANDINIRRPISIASFSPPGTGRFFPIQEIVRTILGPKAHNYRINISQFTSTNDLYLAFKTVRKLIEDGKIPLVFFDEFDTQLDNNYYGWLKHFIMPMRHGEYYFDGETNKIGKSIFVFGSGISDSFEQFAHIDFPKSVDLSERQRKMVYEFEDVKGSAFVNELHGHINILGPNQFNNDDHLYIIRRACMIRSLLEMNLLKQFYTNNNEIKIDKSVVTALLRIPVYKNGARSIESIIGMSNLDNVESFTQACLPPKDQLDMHVDTDTFNRWITREILFGDSVDKIAMHIHESYLSTEKHKINALQAEIKQEEKEEVNLEKLEILISNLRKPTLKAWDDLSEYSREMRRRYLDEVPIRLEQIGYKISLKTQRKVRPIDFSQKVIEVYARLEHERWMQEKIRLGWVYGPHRNDKIKTHPSLVHWEELPEDWKYIDRQAILEIQKSLATEGFIIEKITDKNPLV